MATAAVAGAFAAIDAALAVLNAELDASGAEVFSAADPLAGLAGGCLDILAGAGRVQAKVAGLVARATGTYADTARAAAPPDAPVQALEMAIAAEVGCVLSIGDRAAGALLGQSHALATSLPRTLAALRAGTISWQHARVMVDETATLEPAGAAALEAHFLDPHAPNPARGCPAGDMPAYRFRRKARTWRERHHAESLEQRHAKSVLDRRVECSPDQDGMAWFSAYLPADQAAAAWDRLTAVSRAVQGPTETRTLSQLRADVFTSALLDSSTGTGNSTGATTGTGTSTGNSTGGTDGSLAGNGEGNGGGAGRQALPSPPIRAQVLVTVPVFSLLGLTEEPATLDGYGPIPASMARKLVADGAESFYRVLVDPRDGAPLEIGRTSYRVSKAMRNWLRLRDGKCPFPGCSNHSLDNEADHLLAWHKAAPPASATSANPAPNTTDSATPAAGNPHQPPKTNHPAGPHPPAGTTKANTRTGNHPTGRTNTTPWPTPRATPRPGTPTSSTPHPPREKTACPGSCTPGPDCPATLPALRSCSGAFS